MSQPHESRRTDEVLLQMAVANPDSGAGRAASSELLGRYRNQVYQWCYRYVRDHDQALDVAQDVLLRAYRKLGSFEGRSQFSSWLFMVTRTTCLNEIKKTTIHSDPEFDLEGLADPAHGPDHEIELEQDRDRMLKTMRRVLDPQEQEAMVLRYFEQMPPDEISRLLRLDSRSGARGLLQRARRKLVAAVNAEREVEDQDG